MSNRSLIDEKQLIELCKHGDRRAYMHIYDKYSRAMFNVAYRFMNDSDDAQDMMQNGFIKAFSRLDSYSGEVLFGGWLKRIVVNTCLDEIRKKKDMVSFDDARISEPLIEMKSDFEIDEDAFEIVKIAIGQLPENYRLVVNLFLIEGYDYEEISSILDIKRTTARSLVSRAKIKLRELIDLDELREGSLSINN